MLGGNGPATKASSGISAAGSLDPRDGKGAVAAGIALDKVSAALSTASCASDGTGMSLQTALGLFGLEHFQELWGPELDAKCVVAWDAQAERGGGGGTIVLAFRGTTRWRWLAAAAAAAAYALQCHSDVCAAAQTLNLCRRPAPHPPAASSTCGTTCRC